MTFNEFMLMVSTAIFTALWMHAWHQESKKETEIKREPLGFLDIKTGRRVEIDPVTRKEIIIS